MAERRVIPNGRLDEQVQLSLSLHHSRGRAGLKKHTTDSDRLSLTSAEQHMEADVRRLPDVVVADRPSTDVIQRLREKREKDHRETVKNLHGELAVLGKHHEKCYRSSCEELLSSLGELDQRLDSLMDQMEHQQQVNLQDLNGVWDLVRENYVLKRRRIRDLDQNLTGYENQRKQQIALLLRKYCTLLERISFLGPCDVYRLLDAEAMMINNALLANHRSIARLLLHLLEENLQKELVLRLRWQDRLKTWRNGRVQQEVDRLRELINSESIQNPYSLQQAILEMKRSRLTLSEKQCHIIQHICSLVPPTCSLALVSDWYNHLTDVNQKIDCCHSNFLDQLHFSFEQSWQSCLAEVEKCKEALCALELSEEDVEHIVSSQILNLIGQCQRPAQDRLDVLDRAVDLVARHAGKLSLTLWNVLRGASLLWEMHSQAVESKRQQLEEQLRLLRHQREEEIQKKEDHLNILLDRLRQESTEESLRSSLDKVLVYLDDIRNSSSFWYSEVDELLESFPAVLVEELHTYSAALSRYYSVSDARTLTLEELRTFYHHANLDISVENYTRNHPISSQNALDHTQALHGGLLKKAHLSLAELYTSDTKVSFASRRDGAYSGPAFEVIVPDPPGSRDNKMELILFPRELLAQSLSQMRVLFFDHLEQHFHDVMSSSIAMIVSRKKALGSEHELHLHLHKLRPQRIETDIHDIRSAELHVHRECVSSQHAAVLHIIESCQSDLENLQTSTSRTNEDFITNVSKMEELLPNATTSHTLEGLSSTLQECLCQHIQEIQQSQRAFKHSVQQRLEQIQDSNTKLVKSFRLFSEGGNFSPEEVMVLLRQLEQTLQHVDALADRLQMDIESFESRSLKQVKDVVNAFEKKLSLPMVETRFLEEIQSFLTNGQVQIKAEAAHSNLQKMLISSKVEDLKRLTENAEVSQEKVLACLSSLGEELKTRCQYLDCSLAPSIVGPVPQHPLQGSFAVAARTQSRQSRHVASSDDSVMAFNNCFRSNVNSFLKTTSEMFLLAAEDFYRKKEYGTTSCLVAKSFNQLAESLNDRLLGYQEQANQFNITSVQEFNQQLSLLEKVVLMLPGKMFGNYGRQQEKELLEGLQKFRTRMEETLSATNHNKHASQLKVRLGHPACKEELDALRRREGDRQTQYRSDIDMMYHELQEYVHSREEDFKASLSSLTETLLFHMDALFSVEQITTPEIEARRGLCKQESLQKSSRIGTGLPNLPPLADGTTESSVTSATTTSSVTMVATTSSVTLATKAATTTSSVTMPSTAAGSISKATSSPVHQEILLQSEQSLKRYVELSRVEMDHFRTDRDRLLVQLQRWTQHWNQQIDTLSTLNAE